MDSFQCLSKMFYNKKKLPKLASLTTRRAEAMTKMSIPFLSYHTNLLGETEIWKVFTRQVTAIGYAKKMGMGLMVFAFESKALGVKGKRNFVVTHPKKLWIILKSRPVSCRCSYEVLPDFHNCKLYFDLEFSKVLNPKTDGFKIIQTFIFIVNHFLKKEFEIIAEIKDVLILDSTTDKKFSRHLIYNSQFLFINNRHAGNFVLYICEQLDIMLQSSSCFITGGIDLNDISEMFIKRDCSSSSAVDITSKVLFCDKSVYSKNRNFRTYNSSKYMMQRPLTISSDNQYIPIKGPSEENYFLDSLITYIPEKTRILQYELENRSCVESNLKLKSDLNVHIDSNNGKSPFPSVDSFIELLLGEGVIRSWKFYNNEILVFDINRIYRFCYNINREHNSNRILYVANVKKGVYYQKCRDPDCHNFKSNEWALPSYVLASIIKNNVDELNDEEETLFDAVEKAEEMFNRNQRNEVNKISTYNENKNINHNFNESIKSEHDPNASLSDDEIAECALACEQQMLTSTL